MTRVITEELINELKEVKTKFKETIDYNNSQDYDYRSVCDYAFPKSVVEYVIITDDGSEYIINGLANEFYEFDFNSIIYVCKHFSINKDNKYSHWDTVNGFYNDYRLHHNTVTNFNVTKVINDYID